MISYIVTRLTIHGETQYLVLPSLSAKPLWASRSHDATPFTESGANAAMYQARDYDAGNPRSPVISEYAVRPQSRPDPVAGPISNTLAPHSTTYVATARKLISPLVEALVIAEAEGTLTQLADLVRAGRPISVESIAAALKAPEGT